MKEKIKTKVKKCPWDRGWGSPVLSILDGGGNGYVGVPEGHPWYLVPYDTLDTVVEVYGGLTYGKLEADGLYWVGFDTAHACQDKKWKTEQGVRDETGWLYQQALVACPCTW